MGKGKGEGGPLLSAALHTYSLGVSVAVPPVESGMVKVEIRRLKIKLKKSRGEKKHFSTVQ